MPLIFILKRFHETHAPIPRSSYHSVFYSYPGMWSSPWTPWWATPPLPWKGFCQGEEEEGKSFDKLWGNTHKAPANLESWDLLAEVRVTKGGTNFLAVEVAQRLLSWKNHHSRSGLKQFTFHFFETRFLYVAETALELWSSFLSLPRAPPHVPFKQFLQPMSALPLYLAEFEIEHLLVWAPCKGFPSIVSFDLNHNLPPPSVRTIGIIAIRNLMLYSKSLNCGWKPSFPALPSTVFWYRFWSRKHPTFRHQPAQPAFPLPPPPRAEWGNIRQRNQQGRAGGDLPVLAGEPPGSGSRRSTQSSGGGWKRSRTHHTSRRRRQRALRQPARRLWCACAGPEGTPSWARGARDRDARACARPEGAGALRVGVGVRARCGPRLCGLKQRAKRRRPRAEGTRGPRAAGTDGFGTDAGAPAGLLGLAAACLAVADRFPGPEWPPPRETRRDTGLRRGAAGVRTARTRAARCAAGLGGDQRRGRCSPRGPRAKCPRRRSARPGPAGRAPPSAAGARSLPRLLRGAPGGSGRDPGLARERTRHKLCLLLFLAL